MSVSAIVQPRTDVHAPSDGTHENMGPSFPVHSDSMPSPRDGGLTGMEFRPIAACDLMNQVSEDLNWVWEQYLPVGSVAILAAKPKVGKSTLVYELAVKVAKGEPFLDRATTHGGVLILAVEEHQRDIRNRLDALGASEAANIYVHVGPLLSGARVLQDIEQFVQDKAINLIVVDTFGMFWSVRDETNAVEVSTAMRPILSLARLSGACILLIHHLRKADGQDGDDIRGSSALFASVDQGLVLKRSQSPIRRVLSARGRYAETPPELTIELTDTGYRALGDSPAANHAMKEQRVWEALLDYPQTLEEVAQKAQISAKKAREHLKKLAQQGRAAISGEGVKYDPFLYSRGRPGSADSIPSSPSPLEEKQEMESVKPTVDEAGTVNAA